MNRFWGLILLGAAFLGVEAAGPRYVEGRIEQAAHERTRGEGAVFARVGTFPAVTKFLVGGKVGRVSVTMTQVARAAITFTNVTYELRDVSVDRSELLQHRKVKVTAVESGALRADIPLPPGSTAAVESGSVIFSTGLTLPLADDLFPCSPTASIQESRLELSCKFKSVPKALRS
jgi:hypothetical protein